jgi:hypothetical protein
MREVAKKMTPDMSPSIHPSSSICTKTFIAVLSLAKTIDPPNPVPLFGLLLMRLTYNKNWIDHEEKLRVSCPIFG